MDTRTVPGDRQIRLLLELVDEMVRRSGTVPVWMTNPERMEEQSPACSDYDDFFNRTMYTAPEGVLAETGSMTGFSNDLVIRYLDRVVVEAEGYRVLFKAGVTVEIRV